MDPSAFVPLLSLLPENARAYVLSALVFLGSLTVLISAMKAIVAGLRDLALRTATTADDEAVSVLSDVVTLIADVAEWCKSLLEVIGAHRAPPLKAIASKLKRSPPVTVLMIAIALLAPSYACAGSQVRTHAQIADALYEPILAAKQAIERRAYEQVGHIRAASLTAEEADGKIAALRERYRPVEGAMNLVIEGYNAYVDAIQKAHADGSDLRTNAAKALLERWQSLLQAARDIGVPMPEVPDALRGTRAMSQPTEHDSMAADMLEVAGNLAALLGRSFGREAAGTAAKALTHLAAEAIRRGVSTDQLVMSLRHISPLEMPWGDKP